MRFLHWLKTKMNGTKGILWKKGIFLEWVPIGEWVYRFKTIGQASNSSWMLQSNIEEQNHYLLFIYLFIYLIWTIFFKINLFIYLFIFCCVGSSFLCKGPLQLRQAGATLHRGARASHRRGLSRCGAQAPDAQAQHLWLTGLAAPRHVGSSRSGARTRVPCIGRRTPNHCATREAQYGPFLKSLLNLLQYCFCFMFWFFGHEARGLLAPQPNPHPLHWKAKS